MIFHAGNFKGHISKQIVKPVLHFRLETWTLTEAPEQNGECTPNGKFWEELSDRSVMEVL